MALSAYWELRLIGFPSLTNDLCCRRVKNPITSVSLWIVDARRTLFGIMKNSFLSGHFKVEVFLLLMERRDIFLEYEESENHLNTLLKISIRWVDWNTILLLFLKYATKETRSDLYLKNALLQACRLRRWSWRPKSGIICMWKTWILLKEIIWHFLILKLKMPTYGIRG